MSYLASSNRSASLLGVCLKSVTLLFMLALVPQAAYAQLQISEFMASNDETLFDEDGDATDWIEIHNASGSAVDLVDWYLTDDEDSLTQWQFPSLTMAPNSFIVVFASGKDRAVAGSELHTNFRLGRGGEYLALVAADGTSIVSDYAPEYPQQFDDISYGGETYFLQATPGSENSQGVVGFAAPVESDLPHGVYSTPQSLNLSSDLPSGEIRYTLDGSEPSTEFGCSPPADGKSWSYEYYEGTWSNVPDFDALNAIESGTVDTISTDVSLRSDNFGLRFFGCLEALTDGYYTLSTTSDDGSRLYVNDQLIVDNDGLHGIQTVANQVFLNKGLHAVRVDYFESNGGESLSVDWVAPLRGQTYLTTVNDGQLYNDPGSSTDFVSFEFDVPADGNFNFLVRVQGVDSNSDSFWVQLDDQAFWEFETGQAASFQNVLLNNGGTNISAQLSAGEHRLTFYPREDGARIDSLTVQASNCEGPCSNQVLEAEIQDISGRFVMAGLDQEVLPGESWFTYSSALTIDKTSIVRAVAVQADFVGSEIKTSSYLFFNDIVDQSPNEESPLGWPGVVPSQQNMDYGMDPEIIGLDRQAVIDSLASLPSISIVTDIDNLLHADFGIYVNAQQTGRYWERPAHIELIDNSGAEPGFSIDAGIRVRGGFSRRSANPKHPFRFYFRGSYGGDLDYPMFGDEGVDSFERLDIRSPNNYSWASGGNTGTRNTFLREIWSRDTQKALGNPYTRSRYYHMYINGQYWGVTMTQERVTASYAEGYFGGDDSDYDVVKHDRENNYRFEASDGFNDAWNQIGAAVTTSIPEQVITDADFSFLEQQVDFDNLIDYVLSNAYEGDLDGAVSWFLQGSGFRWSRANNWYAVRDRTGGGLKWSFLQHDGEHSLGVRRNPSAEENVLGPFAPFDGNPNQFYQADYMNPFWLHQKLVSHIDYRQRVIDRVAELFSEGGVLSNEQGLIRWNQREEQVQPAILAHSARWGDSNSNAPRTVSDWETEVSYVENTFFADRAEVVFLQLLELGLASDISTPQASIVSGTTVDQGTLVTIANNSSGAVYYTTDGSDPRAGGGEVSTNAILLLPGESIVINETTQLTIRILDDGDWSAPIATSYIVDDGGNDDGGNDDGGNDDGGNDDEGNDDGGNDDEGNNDESSEEGVDINFYVIPLANGKTVVVYL